MTDRLSDVGAHIESVQQLGAVVNAMRGIAAARARQARNQLDAADRYAATIAAAIGRALAAVPTADVKPVPIVRRRAVILFLAEQGFAGAFSERVLEAAGADVAASDVFLVGTRGAMVAKEQGVPGGWNIAMPANSLGIPKTANRIAEALFIRIASGGIDRLDAIFSQRREGGGVAVVRQCLLPIDPTTFPNPANAVPPLLNLPPEVLIGDLTGDYLHARICTAALHAFVAENEARMEAMASARNQIERQLTSLRATRRQVRQEEITAEIIELAAGETASAFRSNGIRRSKKSATFSDTLAE